MSLSLSIYVYIYIYIHMYMYAAVATPAAAASAAARGGIRATRQISLHNNTQQQHTSYTAWQERVYSSGGCKCTAVGLPRRGSA